ncbi:MAG: penicillin-binding transpeptidase domain-containing protein [Hominilimicola sp.]
MPNSKARFVILKIIIALMFAAVAWKLFDLQIMKGDQYAEIANNRLTTNIVEKAPRGEILDRYGTRLVSNKVGYSVIMQKTDMKDEEFNDVINELVGVLYANNCEYYDDLPISFAPYVFQFEDENEDGSVDDERGKWFENNEKNGVNEGMTADEIMQVLKKRYKVSEVYSEDEQRRIVGIRHAAEASGMSQTTLFTLADDISVEAVTQIKERQDEFRGIAVINDYVRQYDMPGLATHILGRTGKINAEEYESNKDLGYGYNDIIGKQGLEKWGEQYLRGVDGTTGTTKEVNGKEITVLDDTEPIPGDYLVLTLDSDLQRVTEESLAKTIENIRASSGVKAKDGADCNAGAAVVIDVKTGDTLAIASHPTYDMSRFDEDYNTLLENDAKPMWNRAVSGLYSPGSTFKPLTAIAALETGNLTTNEIIEDEGVYKYYADYQPTCWIWNEYHMTHGKQNVTLALENSCNFFFYEVGRRMGIDTLGKYAQKFGLGEKTGIELSEEASGHMASPEYKKQVVSNVTSQDWYGGDTLQAAIGQSYSLFTPVQLANYAATIANGGTRYKVNLVKSVRSSVDGSVVKEFSPEVVEKVDMDADVLNSVKQGMKKVVDEGSAAEVFANYGIQVGGKTGTAQVGDGSNNAVFIAYAPFDDPQIAVAVVLEHGVRGTNAAQVAKDIFDEYFHFNDQPQGTSEPTASPSQTNGGLLR